ncbi:MAG: phosphate acyltransferase PlsX, partial [Alphaproteobacteria bacterium]|nr:phosphate acyltransferase PlsX [Alphaproteobacteria bacterium]
MASALTLALDAMGGDHAPGMVVEGVAVAAPRLNGARFLLFGDKARIEPLLAAQPALAGRCEIIHTEVVVAGDEKPSLALRKGRGSSMALAIEAVKEGRAAGAVSAGNTGALMAFGMMALRTLPGIRRPAICTILPTIAGDGVTMLDLGANVECDAETLVQFAVMGEAFARTLLGIARPTVGLLNVGSEEVKGHDTVRLAAQLLRETTLPIQFKGFVEGDGISSGDFDVVVTDGFTGNIALKTAEGTAKLIGAKMKQA